MMERETGLEPATTCLEGLGRKRWEPLASFLEASLALWDTIVKTIVESDYIELHTMGY